MKECPALVAKSATPKVFWYQTDVNVVLRIMLSDVEDYFLLIDRDHLRFSTTIDERKYYLCMYLFGAVTPEKCEHSNLGREIRIKIPKGLRWTSWPRLCLDNTKNSQICKDPDKVVANKIEMMRHLPIGALLEYKRMHGVPAVPAVPSSNEDTTSDVSDQFVDENW